MITSTANPQIKNLIQLQKKNRLRQEQGIFIIEGIKMYREAPTDQVIKTYVSESFYKKHQKEDIWKGESLEIVTDRVFEAASDTKTPQGVLSLVKRFEYDLDDIIQGSTPLIMVLENIQDPGNLGTIVRTGEGAGITGVIMSNGTVDIYNPKTIRATMGSIYRVPFCYAENMQAVMQKLKKCKIQTYAAYLEGSSVHDAQNYKEATAFLIGNEGNGLTRELAESADWRIRIPMCGKVESLNAGIAENLERTEQRHSEDMLELMKEEKEQPKKKRRLFHREKRKMLDRSSFTYDVEPEEVEPFMVAERKPSENWEETVCFSAVERKTVWVLEYKGDGLEDDLRMEQFPYRIGKHGSNVEGKLYAQTVSRLHAQITQDEDSNLWISDFNSTNGTYLNGHLIPMNTPVRIQEGDRVIFATEEYILKKK